MRRVVQRGQRGAALLAALLTVALVATLASAALWQQWRAIEVESAERGRSQAAWVLTGALDWARLILREDARASGNRNVDHLAEPWAVPLREARLSSFLAADRGADTAGSVVDQAFLSGEITDLQSRLNVALLLDGDKPSEPGVQAFRKLFAALALPPAEVDRMVESLRLGQAPDAGRPGSPAPLLPMRPEQLGWLGLSPTTVKALQPYVTVLPARTPVNLNTASAQVIQAVMANGSLADAQRLVAARASSHFANLDQAASAVGGTSGATFASGLASVATAYFEVRGRLRLDRTVIEERSIVWRDGSNVRVLQRERGVVAPQVTAGR